MKNPSVSNAKQIKELQTQLNKLQTELAAVNKASGIDEYIAVKRTKIQSRFERIKKKGVEDKAVGHYLVLVVITAKKVPVFIPLSIASGKKQTGFIYQIEGTAESSIITAKIHVRGEGVTQVTFGTLVYAKIPAGKTATCNIQIDIRGKAGKVYSLIINRINYKLSATDARYLQYSNEIRSDVLKFS